MTYHALSLERQKQLQLHERQTGYHYRNDNVLYHPDTIHQWAEATDPRYYAGQLIRTCNLPLEDQIKVLNEYLEQKNPNIQVETETLRRIIL